MRSALFIFLLTVASLASAQPKPCNAHETSSAEGTTFDFSGTVRAGESFSCGFASELTFRLVPVAGGWQITIQPAMIEQNLVLTNKINNVDPAVLTTVFPNPVHLDDERHFAVVLNLGSTNRISGAGTSLLKVTALKLSPPGADRLSTIQELSFAASIQIRAFNGMPVYAVGGPVKPPSIRSAPDPKYSEEARQNRLQGTVVLSALIAPDGKVGAVEVLRPLGLGLDEEAIHAVQRWKFRPATLNGHPVPVQINVEVNFRK